MSSSQPVIEQQDLPFLNTLVLTFSIVGLVGLIPLGWMLIKYRKDLRNPAGRIVIGLTVCNAIDAIFKLIGRAGINAGLDSGLCLVQGFVLQHLILTQWFLGAVFAYYTARMVLWKKSINSFQRKEGYILGSCFLLPLPISFYTVYGHPNGLDRLIGNADLWCWISTEYYPNYQMYLAYIPAIAIGLIEIFAFFAIVLRVSKDNNAQEVLSTRLPYKRYLLQRYFAYMLFFFFGWIFSILNRLVTVSTKSSVVTLLATQAISNTMLGMLHFLAFWYSWRFHPLYCSDRNSEMENTAAPGLDFEPDVRVEEYFTVTQTLKDGEAPDSDGVFQTCSSVADANLGADFDDNRISVEDADNDKPTDTIYYDAMDHVSKKDAVSKNIFGS
jgi:Slime mold cyclic AMP receptor